ncbi:unnamed protein product [Amoebophrya sp. A120]|nr:unnamed protein product [Amoebophrya sp. A120]|eukprot:GSA120T00004363001.1
MRSSATIRSPNYRDMKDPELLRYGTPDMILVTHGTKLYVHSSKCAAYSKDIQDQVLHPDAFFGKMLVIKNNRSVKAAIALLDTIYSQQVAPNADVLFETCEIAQDYGMDLVLQKIKLGLMKRGSVKPLLDALYVMKPEQRVPPVVLEAYAEFTLAETKVMLRYDELPALLRRRIAETRVKILETLLRTQPSLKHVYEENKHVFFREVPDEEYTAEGASPTQTGQSRTASKVRFQNEAEQSAAANEAPGGMLDGFKNGKNVQNGSAASNYKGVMSAATSTSGTGAAGARSSLKTPVGVFQEGDITGEMLLQKRFLESTTVAGGGGKGGSLFFNDADFGGAGSSTRSNRVLDHDLVSPAARRPRAGTDPTGSTLETTTFAY